MERVIDVMSWPAVRVGEETRVREAEEIANQKGIRHLVVMGKEGLAGVLCTCDLWNANQDDPVSTHMSAPVVTIGTTASALEAALLMGERAVGCLPVVAGEAIVGMVTRGDLNRAGLPRGMLGAMRCTACQGGSHVRADEHGSGIALCLECQQRAQPPGPDDELGGGD